MPKMKFADEKPVIMSIGGSLIVPGEKPDATFLAKVKDLVERQAEKGKKIIIVTGGGKICRNYQDAAREASSEITDIDLDWIGIETTKLNGFLLKKVLGDLAHEDLITTPISEPVNWEKGALIVSGWEPGGSSDRVVCLLAELHSAKQIINLSNIDHVYSEDPRKNPEAESFDNLSWADYRKMVGNEWSPGLSAPFDPIASKICNEGNIDVAIVNGADMANVENLINGEEFTGTVLS
jgi:uridylate kinase